MRSLEPHHLARAALVLGPVLLIIGACARGGMGQVATTGGKATDSGGLASSLDAPLAVGGEGRPAWRFALQGSAGPSVELLSPRADVLDAKDGLLIGKSAGLAPVLVAIDGTVIDLIHVTVRPVERIAVHGIDTSGADMGPLTEPIELVAGDGMRLVPQPYAGGEKLVGVATSTWVVDPPIAVILREGLPNRVRLVARQPGSATVQVTMFGATSLLRIEVVS